MLSTRPTVVRASAAALAEADGARQNGLDVPDQQEPERLTAAQRLIASIPDPVVLVSADGLVREANAAALSLFPALSLQQPLWYGLRVPDILETLDRLHAGGTASLDYRTRLPTERSFDVRITSLASSDGAADRGDAMLLFRELTEAHRLERMRVDFVANVSHELRTPLASLVGFVDTLQGPARDDPAARDRFLDIMRTQAWRMMRLIEDLLSLSRIELRAHVAPNLPVDLRSVTAQIIDTLSTMAHEHGVAIAFAAPEEPAIVLGDADELSRVVENLVENAVKYGESGKRVDVAIERRNDAIELSVRDYGPGIAEEHLPRLTERFYRADVVESRQKGGTGLGLAIVKHIVARHRGKLAIESELGHGATFRVTLPEPPADGRPEGN
jgi:two-component system, OmpR family, phosphate regulon sensor histidine kinase PhoR